MLKIYNTLSGKKQSFRTLSAGEVRLYVCGVTVYDLSHLGHARSAIVFDVICRFLEYRGYHVRYVRNFTDVDDKIIDRANHEGKSWKEISKTYIKIYHEDMARLGVRPASEEPKATDYIEEMVKLIRQLMKKGLAYAVEGDVYFRVRRFKHYGRLSRQKPEEMLSGARIEIDKRKEDPLDFALWKSSGPDEPGWKSPWGRGRPGWHIECSTMALDLLGETFDIHGGGQDLVFPHHENEIAQSEGVTGKRFARWWIHNGYVTINREKMSKSLGNFFTIKEIFDKSPWSEAVTAEVIRFLLLSTHYRSPIDWSDGSFHVAKAGLDNFYNLFILLQESKSDGFPKKDKSVLSDLNQFRIKFKRLMDDDFNAPGAIAEFQKFRAKVNQFLKKGISKEMTDQIFLLFKETGEVLGLFQLDPKLWTFQSSAQEEDPVLKDVSLEASLGVSFEADLTHQRIFSDKEVQDLVEEREEARRHRDFKKSDDLRKKLADAGVILEDRPDGTTRVKKG